MAEVLLTTALQMVHDLLIEEANFFLYGVRSEVEEIERELKRMKIFLEYADTQQDEDVTLHYRVEEIRELADEVEDVLEKFSFEISARRRNSGGFKNTIKRYACIFNECIGLQKVGSDIVIIKTRITNLSNSLPIYDVRQAISSNSALEKKQRWQRLTFPHFEEDFVGMEADVRKVVIHLVNNKETQECQRPRVVSICGMGGLGKTSLAKKIYNHNEVRKHFDSFAWVCVTQRWQAREILQEILIGLDEENKEKVVHLTDQQLVEQLYQVQHIKKCLIVLDDIWSRDAWNSLRQAFPNGETGSKILITTRDKQVALHVDSNGFLHEPQCLSEEESWDLLQKKAFPRRHGGTDIRVDPRIEKTGREMVRRCRGLPLAIVVLGGILITKHTYEEWKMVLPKIKTYLAKGDGIGEENGGGVLNVLALSYKNLPYQLKRCFLYLGNFPEDFEINAEKLYHQWVAEANIPSSDRQEGETMMDIAERYLGELAQRCMVQVDLKEISRVRRFKSCRLHDLMRDLCLLKLKERKKGSSLDLDSSTTSKTRRVAIYSNNDEFCGYLAQETEKCQPKDRASKSWQKLEIHIKDFKSLRVLDVEGMPIFYDEFPEAIGELTQCRYLSLRHTSFKKLPSSIGNLVYLQTLDLRTKFSLFIPNILWKLRLLRHLYLPSCIDFDREKDNKLRLDGLSNLETLVNFDSYYCDVKDLKLKNLRVLKAEIWKDLEEDLGHLATAMTSLNPFLQHSNIRIWGCSFRSKEELAILEKLLGCDHLYKLDLRGSISSLPEHFHFSPSLCKLTLWDSQLEEDPMQALEKLPSLIHLEIRAKSFMGMEMVCSAIGFPQLSHLSLQLLNKLEDWRVDEGAFPKLSHIDISFCPKLKMIPDGLKFVTTLNELILHDMPEKFKNRVRVVNGKEGDDFHKVRHVPSIKFTGF